MSSPQDPYRPPTTPPGHAGPGAFGEPVPRAARNGLGVAALVLGILSLVSWFLFVGGIFGVVAVVLGLVGRGRAKRGEATNGGMALAGVITGMVGVLLTILVIAGVVSLLGGGKLTNLTECLQQAGSDQAAIDRCAAEFEEVVRGG
ncbi:MAG: DUF4190 domain-containing protein [Mycobacteriales bacterium]